jgi:hypothetical protein
VIPARLRAELTFWVAFWGGYWTGQLLTSAYRNRKSPTKENNPDAVSPQ